MAWIGRWGFDHTKIQFTRTEFPSSPLGVMMAVSNKSPRLEMMRFRKKLHKFDKTKHRMVARGVAVKAIVTELMLQRYFSWKMRCCRGGGNHHGEERFFYHIEFLVCFFT